MPIIATKTAIKTTFLVVDEKGTVTSTHPFEVESELTLDGFVQALNDLLEFKENLNLSDDEVQMLVRTGNLLTLGNIQAASLGVQNQYQFPTTVGTIGQVIGYQGAFGLQWVTGGAGAQGDRGFQGYQGFQGFQGYQGYQGFQGFQGYQGFQGFQGNQGNQGTAGPSTQINASAITTNSTFYPVFVASAGSNQTASVNTASPTLSFNPNSSTLTTGTVNTSNISSKAYIFGGSGIITESTTSRTLGANDNGAVLMCTSSSAVTITVPTGLDVGFSITVIQAGAGQITFSASSTTINNRQSHTKSAGQWAIVSLFQRSTNNFVLAGDTAA